MSLDIFGRWLVIVSMVGLTWLYAWAVNPAVSSGTVWFVGLVAGSIASSPRIDD